MKIIPRSLQLGDSLISYVIIYDVLRVEFMMETHEYKFIEVK